MAKKVAIIGTAGVPAKYGGFETLTEHLTKYLSEKFELTVYCSSESYDEKLSSYNGAALRYVPLKANGMQSVFYDAASIVHALRYADVILILGVSGCVVVPFVKFLSKKKVVVNIDGLEWKRDKWNGFAKWFLRFSESLAARYADCVVTDNKVIQDYVLTKYSVKSRLITYGGDHVLSADPTGWNSSIYPFLDHKYAFSVCRIEPENNVHHLLAAAAQSKTLPFVVVGNWDVSDFGKELRDKYDSYESIYLLDPIYDQKALDTLRGGCYVYLHGHSAGGTNPSLVEAMYSGLPIFAYDIDYNRETTEHSARYFASTDELVGMLNDLDDSSLSAIGQQMSEIAQRRYRWEVITSQYAELLD